MKFPGVDNQTLELKITNYQYPEVTTGDWDGNWLNIYLNVKSDVGHWQTVDASLTTWEVQELIDWFQDLAANKNPKYVELGFTEPNLPFELLNQFDDSLKRFKIKFNLESRPQSASHDRDYFVDCSADNVELAKVSSDLKQELSKYPERKPERYKQKTPAGAVILKISTGSLALLGSSLGVFALGYALMDKKMQNGMPLIVLCMFVFFISSCFGGIYYVLFSKFWRKGNYGAGRIRIISGALGVAGAAVVFTLGLLALYRTITFGKTLQNNAMDYLAIVAVLAIAFSGIFYAFERRFWKRFP